MSGWMSLRRALGALALVALSGCQLLSGATEKTWSEPAATGGAGGANNAGGTGGTGGTGKSRDKVDLLLVVDNSTSMGDKQLLLASVVEDMLDRLLYPPCINSQGVQRPWEPKPCPADTTPAFPPLADLHLGVITSSLGSHGSDYCTDVEPSDPNQSISHNSTQNDRGRLIHRGPRPQGTTISFPEVQTWNNAGFLVWNTSTSLDPPGESEASLKAKARELVLGADQVGCGFEAPLEAWYRFLVDPTPPSLVKTVNSTDNPSAILATPTAEGVDKALLEQRAAFLRPDSLVGILLISDENDCSVIDGALPADVCDEPVLGPSVDDYGRPTVCAEARKGWPAGYVENNFDSISRDEQGRVTGVPFPFNFLTSQQRQFSTAPAPPSFRMRSGTPECAADPYSPACRQCYNNGLDTCSVLGTDADPPQLRCWDQKRRFGVDMLYPLKRYIDGLRNSHIYSREGYLVPNPLFAGDRTEQDIFFASIVGVPWQDIARNPADLSQGYKPTVATAEAPSVEVDWSLLLGDPDNPDLTKRTDPADILVTEAIDPRDGIHPITKEVIHSSSWNRINGHEKKLAYHDLQFACIFALPDARDCNQSVSSCDCDQLSSENNPLCEKPTADGKGDGNPTTTQYRAKAYPAPRVVRLVQGLGSQGILTSICTPNVTDSSLSSYSYRPATKAIAEAFWPRLKTP